MGKKKASRKGPGGRPSKYKPEYCEMLIAHADEGLSFESFAGVIGVSRDTVFEWAKVHPAFSDAKKIFEPKSMLWWEKRGIKGMGEGKEFNAAVWIFNMRNRFGWSNDPDIATGSEVQGFVFTTKKAD